MVNGPATGSRTLWFTDWGLPMKIIVQILLLLLPISVTLGFQQYQWVPLGLESEWITTIAIDPVDDQTIYAGSTSDITVGKWGGVFKSMDGGATWDTLLRGGQVTKICINPSDQNDLMVGLHTIGFIAAGILKSIDGGNSWYRADSGITLDNEIGINTVAYDPMNPNTLYSGTGGGGFLGTLYRSTNDGTSWIPVTDSLSDITGAIQLIEFNPDSNNIIYVTSNIDRFYRSIDHGIHWYEQYLPVGISKQIGFGGVATTLYLSASTSSLFPKAILKSSDGGLSWFGIGDLLPGLFASTTGVVTKRTTGDVLISGRTWTEFGADSGRTAGIYFSSNGGVTWNPEKDSLNVTTLAISSNTQDIYAGVQRVIDYSALGGIYRRELVTGVEYCIPSVLNNMTQVSVYPNPFNSSTQILMTLTNQSSISINIYGVNGNLIRNLISNEISSGAVSWTWDGTNYAGHPVSSGIYFVRITSLGINHKEETLFIKSLFIE